MSVEHGDFQALVEGHRDRIYTFAFYFLKNREDAEDVTQEVLIRLWNHWRRFEGDHLRAWLMKVTRNVCCDASRRRTTRGRVEGFDGGDVAVELAASPERGPEHDAEATDFRRRLTAAIKSLPEPQKSIVILREVQGLTYDEIASIVGRPLNTVKVYLHRGRKLLRKELREEEAYAQAS